MRLDHEQVVVAGFGENVAGFALDQIAHHVVGNAAAQQADNAAIAPQGLIEHQRYLVVEA